MGNSEALPLDDTTSLDNYNFYNGKGKCKPDGKTIDYIHKNWKGDYHLLELNHSYIQWIFPIREGGLNFDAQPLTKHEAKLFRESTEIKERIIKSYEMMLDFYGLTLEDKTTGKVVRGENYKERYAHLNRSFHNYLRITRILKCLGLVGLEHYKKPLISHFATECFKNDELDNIAESLVKYWFPTLRKEEELSEMEAFVKECIGKTISRKYYDSEEPTWANVLVDDTKEEKETKK